LWPAAAPPASRRSSRCGASNRAKNPLVWILTHDDRRRELGRGLGIRYGVRVLWRLWKPWFVYRPAQLIRRVRLAPATPGWQPLPTAWGVDILADPTKAIGRSIRTTGLYDLAVSETLVRLIHSGDTVIDAGANVGYMTVLSALAAGPFGRVIACEPHPDLFVVLRRNVDAVGRFRSAPVELHNLALGERAGTADLMLPPDFSSNDGVSRIVTGPIGEGRSVPVKVEALDRLIGDRVTAVLKLDVEGFEIHVLRGAAAALGSRRIRHVVFEDDDVGKSQVVRLLQDAGYRVFSVGWTMKGLALSPVERGPLAAEYEAPNCIASLDPDLVVERCAPHGWRVLRNLTS